MLPKYRICTTSIALAQLASPMTESDLQELLAEVQALRQQSVLSGADRIKLWKNTVKLAEAQYPSVEPLVADNLVDMQQALSEAQIAKNSIALTDAYRQRVFRNLHDLAEAEYQPAFEFLMTCLEHPDSIWRWQSLRNIGFHYVTTSNSLFLKKTRELLRHDPDSAIRRTAALILGIHSQWKDQALVTALSCDPQPDVRAVAFASLLELAGVPRWRAWKCWQQVKTGEIQPTWENVQRSVRQEGIDLNGTKLSRKRESETKVNW